MEIKNGYKLTEVGIIPEEWEVMKFKEVTNAITCGVAATPKYVSVNIGKPFLSAQNVQKGKISLHKFKHISLDLFQTITRNNKPEKGDLLYTRVGAGIGEAAIIELDFDFAIYVSLTLIKPKKSLNSYYLKFLLNSYKFKQLATEGQFAGGGVQNLNVEIVRKFPIPLPPLPEQKAIAKVLSDMDNLISGLERQIEKKRLVKQGAMQRLLTAGEDWEVRSLGEVGKITMGQSPSSVNYNHSKIGLPLVQGNADIKNRKTIIRTYTSEITKRCNIDDIIMSVRAPVGEIAKATFDACLGRGVCAITYENDFLYHYLIYIEPTWSKLSTGSTFDSVNSTVIRALEIQIPPLSEQTRIATILSDMDKSIASLEGQLSKYRAVKVGLMQELLSGRKRLVRG